MQKLEDNWRNQLNEFVQAHRQELAALAWGLFLQRGNSDDTLGIALQPKPHFVYCPRDAIEQLNNQVKNLIQEVIGIVNAHQPEKEVLILGIGHGQLKLISFEPEPAPPICFEQLAEDVDTLVERLEMRLNEVISD